MSKVDIVVFGATGFTGRLVVDKLVSLCDKHPYTELSFGVAGRSKEKLLELVKQLEKAGLTTKLPIIVADVSDEGTLLAMARQAKVVMNCTGPYTVLGEPVVKACIESGTHYVDMTAELHGVVQIQENGQTVTLLRADGGGAPYPGPRAHITGATAAASAAARAATGPPAAPSGSRP